MVPWSHLRQPGDCGQTWHRNWHFKLVIRLSNAKQLAFLFCTILRSPAGPAVPGETLRNASLSAWSRSEQPETSFFSLQLKLLKRHMTMKDIAGRHMLSRCGLFLLIAFWWGWTFCASNSLELEQLFMPLRHDLTTVPKGSNARHLL